MATAVPMNPRPFLIDRSALAAAQRRETQGFLHTHPRSAALAGEDAQHYLFGVPLYWMRDWSTLRC